MKPLSLQPIPYQGSKRALAPRICAHFPRGIRTLYEPFAGSAAVTLYAAQYGLAEHFVIGEVCPALAALWRLIIEEPAHIAAGYRALWEEQFAFGPGHFNAVRDRYNAERDAASLLYLIARCVKNAVRFSQTGDFTQSADKRRNGKHPDRFAAAAQRASELLKGKIHVYCGDFAACIAAAGSGDLVYLDPPYQGTTYGADKRYAAQLPRERLVACLADLNRKGVAFILSYDGTTGSKVHGVPLPESLKLSRFPVGGGRSTQATLLGRNERTSESLYLCEGLAGSGARFSYQPSCQPS
jgi:DNA adenine methylase